MDSHFKPDSKVKPTEPVKPATPEPTKPADPKPTQPAHTHSYTSSVTQSPTCTDNGVRTYTCSCGTGSYTESIPATGHAYSNATCTSLQTCSRCGATNGSALGHDFGNNNKTCSRCGTANPGYVAPQPVHQHTWVTEQVFAYYICSCGYTSTDDDDISEHNIWNGCGGFMPMYKTITYCSGCKQPHP